MRAMRGVTALILLLAACAFPAAHAQIFKWVDANGVTNYTSAPPASGVATQLDEGAGRLSTIEAYDYGPDLAATRGDALRNRVARLEEELDRHRQGAAAQDAAAAEAHRPGREQCLPQRRTDCEEPDALFPDEPSFVTGFAPKRRFFPPGLPGPKPKPPIAKDPPRLVKIPTPLPDD